MEYSGDFDPIAPPVPGAVPSAGPGAPGSIEVTLGIGEKGVVCLLFYFFSVHGTSWCHFWLKSLLFATLQESDTAGYHQERHSDPEDFSREVRLELRRGGWNDRPQDLSTVPWSVRLPLQRTAT